MLCKWNGTAQSLSVIKMLALSYEVQASHDQNLSELLQHEIDHLDGILTVDRITDVKTLCTREEFEKRYRASSPYALTPAK